MFLPGNERLIGYISLQRRWSLIERYSISFHQSLLRGHFLFWIRSAGFECSRPSPGDTREGFLNENKTLLHPFPFAIPADLRNSLSCTPMHGIMFTLRETTLLAHSQFQIIDFNFSKFEGRYTKSRILQRVLIKGKTRIAQVENLQIHTPTPPACAIQHFRAQYIRIYHRTFTAPPLSRRTNPSPTCLFFGHSTTTICKR